MTENPGFSTKKTSWSKTQKMATIPTISYQRNFTKSSMTADETWHIPIPSGDIDTHHFFNEMVIDNSQNANRLKIKPDQNEDKEFYVPPNVVWVESFKDTNMRFSRLDIEEPDSTAINNQVHVIVRKLKLKIIKGEE